MNEKPVSVLLIDEDLEDTCLIEEAFSELEEVQFTRTWLRAGELLPVDRVGDALEILAEEKVDVVLLALSLPDAQGSIGLRRIQASFPDTPIVILAGDDEEDLAISLIRQGAQDYLLKTELDCIPLARSLRCAMERHRLRSALRSVSLVDDLTGLYSAGGFYHAGHRHWRLAELTDRDLRLYLVDLKPEEYRANAAQPAEDRDNTSAPDTDMLLLLTAECLRGFFDEIDVIARIARYRFACVTFGDSADRSGELRDRVREIIERPRGDDRQKQRVLVSAGSVTRLREAAGSLEELLRAAEPVLWENGRSTVEAGR